jgi:hypothetical protein
LTDERLEILALGHHLPSPVFLFVGMPLVAP